MNGDRVCIIGAGSSGLVAARNLLKAGFRVEILEQHGDLGGIWNYELPSGRVYASTHMISSKPFTQFPDFPMPENFPDYPHHSQVLEYLRSYADHFDLTRHITFGSRVESVEPADGHTEPADGHSSWTVAVNGEARRYTGVVIANGHNWSPRYPDVRGTFAGETLHSAFYRTPDVLFGKRVLVVGAGNSGCDIAVEAVTTAKTVFLSTRRAYHYVPKYVFGRPADQVGDVMLKLGIPLSIRRAISSLVLRLTVGSHRSLGLPEPDHKLYEVHPTINTLLPYYVSHGRIRLKPDLHRLDDTYIVFTDGSSEPIDLIIYATGYDLTFPFIDKRHLNWQNGRPELYLNVFHPEYDNFFVAGMIQPDSGQFGLVHWQMRAVAAYLKARRDGRSSARWIEKKKEDPNSWTKSGIRYKASPRHRLEVEHWSYLKALKRAVRRLER